MSGGRRLVANNRVLYPVADAIFLKLSVCRAGHSETLPFATSHQAHGAGGGLRKCAFVAAPSGSEKEAERYVQRIGRSVPAETDGFRALRP